MPPEKPTLFLSSENKIPIRLPSQEDLRTYWHSVQEHALKYRDHQWAFYSAYRSVFLLLIPGLFFFPAMVLDEAGWGWSITLGIGILVLEVTLFVCLRALLNLYYQLPRYYHGSPGRFDGPSRMPEWERELIEEAPDRNVAEGVRTALWHLLEEDKYLLEADVNERSISHRLALHLEEEFPDWDVDCEYNRDGHEPKRLRLDPESVQSDDTQGTTVYPDIIVHKRREPRNLLAIEIKKSNGGSGERDLCKLCALRNELQYRFGLFLRFDSGRSGADISEVRWSLD